MRENPWQAINVITGETVGWYHTEAEGIIAHFREPEVNFYYRPGRKTKVVKK